jgi:HEAT repeat protein
LDCHAEVRAYDPKHPKGRKFTPSELKKHRDQWFAICSASPFTPRQHIQVEGEAPSLDPQLFDSLRTDDITPARQLVARFMTKPEKIKAFVNKVLKQLDVDSEETRWKIAYVVEELIEWNPALIPASTLEKMSLDESFSVRSAAAVCYYKLAFASPGSVPLNIVTRLADINEDWYVHTPAIACLKRLARSRPLALDIIFSYLDHSDEHVREYGAHAIMDISTVDPWLLENRKETIERYLRDNNPNVVNFLVKALKNLKKPPLRHDYPAF